MFSTLLLFSSVFIHSAAKDHLQVDNVLLLVVLLLVSAKIVF